MSEEELAQLQRQIQRERTARKEAERLLEEKSPSLYRAHQQLQQDAAERIKHEASLKEAYEKLERSQDAALNIMADLGREVEERKSTEEEVRRLNDELEQKVIARTAALERARYELEQANRG